MDSQSPTYDDPLGWKPNFVVGYQTSRDLVSQIEKNQAVLVAVKDDENTRWSDPLVHLLGVWRDDELGRVRWPLGSKASPSLLIKEGYRPQCRPNQESVSRVWWQREYVEYGRGPWGAAKGLLVRRFIARCRNQALIACVDDIGFNRMGNPRLLVTCEALDTWLEIRTPSLKVVVRLLMATLRRVPEVLSWDTRRRRAFVEGDLIGRRFLEDQLEAVDRRQLENHPADAEVMTAMLDGIIALRSQEEKRNDMALTRRIYIRYAAPLAENYEQIIEGLAMKHDLRAHGRPTGSELVVNVETDRGENDWFVGASTAFADELEKFLSQPALLSSKGQTNITNVAGVIQIGSSGTQNVHLALGSARDLFKRAQDALAALELNEETRDLVDSTMKQAEKQLDKPQPNPRLLRPLLTTVSTALAAVGGAGDGLSYLHQLMQLLGLG